MKAILFALLFLLPLPAVATTWYVRVDGGTLFSPGAPGQCDGTTDAAYPGHGNNQHCALSDPRFLYSIGTGAAYKWVISGGDTVLFRGGPWRIGQNTSASCGPFSNNCSSDGASIPSPPAGTASQPTTFRGENYASCSSKTQLYGGYTINSVFDLRGTNNVQLQCLEITDHSQCTTLGAKPSACNRAIIDDYAKNGIVTDQNTHDLTLTDLDIHGFRDNGIIGAVGGVVSATRVRVAFNGQAGWNFDDGIQTKSVNGQMNWSYVTIEGNGCIEEYPITHTFPAAYCYDDGNGGYGDGVGTPDTQINFAVDHSTIRYNTQDGLDLLHTSGSSITVANSSFYANMGQQLKLGPMASTSVTNNVFLTNCKRMSANIPGAPAGWNAGLSDFCRAQAGVVMVQRGDNGGGGTYLWQNNDFVGYAGDAMFESGNCTDSFVSKPTTDCNTANITFENNILVGYPYVIPSYHYGDLPPTGTDGGDSQRFKTLAHNIYFNMRTCPQQTASTCTDPHLAGEPTFTIGVPIAETAFDTVNFALTSASTNAIGTGLSIPGLTTDYNGATRTVPTTIGALIYTGPTTSSPPPPPTSPTPSKPSAPKKPTATAVFTVTPGSAITGKAVIASIKVTGTTDAIPGGTVTLYLPNGPVQLSLSSGTASSSFAFSGPGTYTLSAAYSGDGTYAATYSNDTTVNVTGGSASIDAATASAARSLAAPTSAAATTTMRRLASATQSSLGSATTPATASNTCQPLRIGSREILPSAVPASGCDATTQVSIVPAYRTLYAEQPAELQSFVLGGGDQSVTWSILSQPSHSDGHLLNTQSRDTVFTATVAGRYTLIAVSLADSSQIATTTLYVTGHTMPYHATALGTEPVDCTVDPALVGQTYEVGPSQTYQHVRDLPLAGIGAGSTIRIHNEDTSGLSPTTYHEFLDLSQHAIADQPLRLCGVPDSTGHLPILDATDATPASLTTGTPTGIITVAPTSEAPANIQIEGIELRNANASNTYQMADGTLARWAADAGCLNITAGQNITVIGNDLSHCSTGGHSSSVVDTIASPNTLWEGNHLHDNGVVGSNTGNQLSLEASGEIVQFNQLDSYPAGAFGANIRSSSSGGNIIRYNYLGGSPTQQIDLAGARSTTSSRSLPASAPKAGQSAEKTDNFAPTIHLVYGNYLGGRSAASTSLAPAVNSR